MSAKELASLLEEQFIPEIVKVLDATMDVRATELLSEAKKKSFWQPKQRS